MATEEALDFSLKKPKEESSSPLAMSVLELAAPQLQSPESTSKDTLPRSRFNSAGSFGQHISPQPSSTSSPSFSPEPKWPTCNGLGLFRPPGMPGMDPLAAAMLGHHARTGLLTPASGMLPMSPSFLGQGSSDQAFFPTASLALSALHRRRRGNAIRQSADLSPGEGCGKKLKTVPDDKKDEAYWERRRKNNDAAKRSRDTRRAKEEEIAIRAAVLEQENLRLRAEITVLKQQTSHLHVVLYEQAQRLRTAS